MKNWKSTGAFLIFVGVYIYTVISKSSDGAIHTTGIVALASSLFMMFRSQVTTDMLKALIEKVGTK